MRPGCRRIESVISSVVLSFNHSFSWLGRWLQLTKIALCLPVACSSGFGYILCRPVLEWSLVWVMLAVLALACGAAAGNSLQEIDIDRLYARTSRRPLVTGRVGVREARLVCGTLLCLGLVLLLVSSIHIIPLLLGASALVAYNLLYTPLKQISPFALVPGAIAGALPPLIGWTAAGGALLSAASWLLFSLFFLWQIPHFFLIFFRHRHDYEQVGRPILIRQISEPGLCRVFLVWLLALVTVILTFPLLLPHLLLASKVLLLILAGEVLAVGAFSAQFGRKGKGQGHAFLCFNACFFLTMVLVMAVQLWW
ncbi:MAG: UbiA family prenyltransferase [Desulfobulbus sp.]|nr:UbiA family prenyltransferase [Desulfobulbus sp.]